MLASRSGKNVYCLQLGQSIEKRVAVLCRRLLLLLFCQRAHGYSARKQTNKITLREIIASHYLMFQPAIIQLANEPNWQCKEEANFL